MEKKRIDFYCSAFLTGGIETTLLQLLKQIDSNIFKVRLVILYRTLEQEVLLAEIPKTVEIVYIVESSLLNYFRSKRLKRRLSLPDKLIEEILLVNLRRVILLFCIRRELKKADVVVDYGMCLTKYRNLLCKVKSIVYCHFSLSHLDRGNFDKNLNRIKEFNHYSMIISICDEMREQLIKYLPDYPGRIERIYNYVDFEYVIKKSQDSLPYNPAPFVLAIGRLDETQKDFTTLIKGFAVAKIQHKIPHKLIILGKGRDEAHLSNLIVDLQMSQDIILQGFDSNPYKWLAQCTLFIHSSKFEGLPTVVIEAMLLKKCVIASHCPTGVTELLANGKAGRLFEVGNYMELAVSLKEVINDEDLMASYIEESQFVLEQFTIDKTIKKLERILMSF